MTVSTISLYLLFRASTVLLLPARRPSAGFRHGLIRKVGEISLTSNTALRGANQLSAAGAFQSKRHMLGEPMLIWPCTTGSSLRAAHRFPGSGFSAVVVPRTCRIRQAVTASLN